MPFIGRDWRSPGEAWVKTESLGWQRMKLIEAQLRPGSCQTAPFACSSWPPKTEFGQHMEQHCEQNLVLQQSNPARCAGYGGSCCNSDAGSSSGSGSSRAGSESPSPNNSPEKCTSIPNVIISSPYGQYSCCAHHFESAPGSPKSLRLSSSPEDDAKPKVAQPSMTKSLSRESVSSGSGRTSFVSYKNLPTSPNSVDNHTGSDVDLTLKGLPLAVGKPNAKLNDSQRSESELVDRPAVMDGFPSSDESETCVPKRSTSTNQSSCNSQWACCFYCKQNQHRSCNFGGSLVKTAPYCRISVRTREVAMYNTISEAFYRLDFCNAIHDIRRFNYICKLLHLLITQNLTSLSGCATRVLFTMLEQVAWEVSSNKRNIHVLKSLLNELRLMLQKYYCWGRPIGSSLLWQQHFDTIERISRIVDGIELAPSESETGKGVTFSNLPVEMVREILLRLNDYRDLVNSAQASPVMQNMIDDQYLWKKLCAYHFTREQLKLALENHDNLYAKQYTRRGLKYSRTTSADGRVSYRNPISHDRKQSQDCRSLGNSKQENASAERHDINCTDEKSTASSSYVTRAIRIFNKDGSRNQNPLKIINISSLDEPSRKSQQRVLTDRNGSLESKQQRQGGYYSNNIDQSSRDIDWERVFHQLRKKFDLKEEYADCLLLCRHCRCLFWRSFGHPCIKGEDEHVVRRAQHAAFDEQSNTNGHSSSNQLGSSNPRQDRRRPTRDLDTNEQRLLGSRDDRSRHRPSVATLSRSFDNRTQVRDRGLQLCNENSAPNSSRCANNNGQARNVEILASCPNVGDRHQSAHPERFDEPSRRAGQVRNSNDTHGSSENELVPKHVAISPQAFLKFFSL